MDDDDSIKPKRSETPSGSPSPPRTDFEYKLMKQIRKLVKPVWLLDDPTVRQIVLGKAMNGIKEVMLSAEEIKMINMDTECETLNELFYYRPNGSNPCLCVYKELGGDEKFNELGGIARMDQIGYILDRYEEKIECSVTSLTKRLDVHLMKIFYPLSAYSVDDDCYEYTENDYYNCDHDTNCEKLMLKYSYLFWSDVKN
jgi:hypothetical protein